MNNLFLPFTGGIFAVALVFAACFGGGDDESPQTQAPVEQAGAATTPDAEQAASQPSQSADAEAPAEQAQAEPPADEQAEPAEEPPAEVEEPESTLPADQLAYGSTVQGAALSADEPVQFRFQGNEGDLVRILVDGLDGMDPIVTLLEPNRTEIASNDDVSVANRDSLLIATLPSSGLQVIWIVPFNADFAGAFALTVELLEPETADDSAIIAIGDSVQARLDTPGDIDTFEFAGDAGQVVQIRADGAIGVDPFMEVFGPDGAFLDIDDDSGHGLDAEIDLALTQSGSYRVDVFPSAVGRPGGERHKIGDYTFSVQVLTEANEASGQTATSLAGLALTYLDAVQQSDALTVFGLSGPEQIDQTGWQSAEDVTRDISRQQDIITAGTPGNVRTEVEGDRARVRVDITVPGAETVETLRFDATNVNGQWLVDFVERFVAAPAGDATAAAADS